MSPFFITGPTAVGKTAVAIEVARQLGAVEIVSADSMQVYRGFDIGTAKPTAAERAAVWHHLLDVAEPTATFDVRQFLDRAHNALRAIAARGNRALVVGGTGLYIRALRRGLFDGPGRDPAVRARLELLSAATLFAELERVDPVTAARIDRRNPRRLVRALEVFHATGRPLSEWQAQPAQPASSAVAGCALDRPRAELHARIEARVDAQLAAGWLEETRALAAKLAIAPDHTAWQAAGYRELAAHLRGELTLAEATERIKARTRQLARRQLTWFRREPGLIWLALARDEPVAAAAARVIAAWNEGAETTI